MCFKANLYSYTWRLFSRIADLAAGGGDDEEYRHWKLTEETKAFQRQLREVERKHLVSTWVHMEFAAAI